MIRPLLRALAVLAALAAPAAAEIVSIEAVQPEARVGLDGAGMLSIRGQGALHLEMIRLNGNRVAFRDPQSGMFLRAGVGQATQLSVVSPHIRGWETFELIPTARGHALRSVQNGLYVGADPAEPRLAAVWGTAGLGQTYRLRPVTLTRPAPDLRPVVTQAHVGRWRLDTLYGAGGQPMPLDAQAVAQMHLGIDAQGALSGNGGCNSFNARLVRENGALAVRDFLTTRRGCANPARQVEILFHAALTGARHFTLLQGSQWLDLRDENGSVRARFRRM